MIILGISHGHDASACLIINGVIVADAAEERFTRVKHDASPPCMAISYCLKEANITSDQIDVIAIGGQYLPIGMERYFALSPEQEINIAALRPAAAKARDLLLKKPSLDLPIYLNRFALSPECNFVTFEHHYCHAAAAFFTRGRRDQCIVLTMDGIGEGTSVALWKGQENTINLISKWGQDASFGWFYGNVTEALGWQHGDGEGTTMGLAPYGDARVVGDRLNKFHPVFSEGNLVIPHNYGQASFVNDHGNYHWHFSEATEILKIVQECGPENVAARAQEILEDQILMLVQYWTSTLGIHRLACGGGIFMNVKLNQRIWHDASLEEHWVYPNPGDAGLAVGAALAAWHQLKEPIQTMKLEHLYYGPAYSNEEIRLILDERGLDYRELDEPSLKAAELLANNKIVGWFQGRMEAGPRALGNRSILMSANHAENKDTLNARVKFRQSFRPFCPAMLFEKKEDYLECCREAAFMITAFDVTSEKRGSIPAVVHIDGTLRPQTVRHETNARFHELIKTFGDLTGEYLVLSTSFNVRNEPIVCHPREAIKCFFDTGIDALVIGNFILEKSNTST